MTERVELRTKRLLLRPFQLEDVDDIYGYARDLEYGRYASYRRPLPYTRQDAQEFVARQLFASWSTSPAFAVVLNSEVVGGIDLGIDETHEIAELGYDLARGHWGSGLIPEAAHVVIDWALGEYGLAKIYATADIRNRRSTRVMEKLGMKCEGLLRSHRKGRDERIDEAYYGLLSEDWERMRTR